MSIRAGLLSLYGYGVSLGTGTFTQNGAASGGHSVNWTAYSFAPVIGGTVSKIRVWVHAVNGTLGASDLVCDIYSDNAGSPNVSLASSSTVTTTPTGQMVVEFTGFSQAITAGTLYWIVLRNANATPTTNYPTYARLSNLTNLVPGSNAGTWDSIFATSTNSGGAWTETADQGRFLVVEYSGGAKEGMPLTVTASTATQIFSTREGGLYFTSPANVTLNVIGMHFAMSRSGSPTGSFRGRIYTGATPSLQGTTSTMVATANSTTAAGLLPLYFGSVIAIPPSTIVRAVGSETTQSDGSANRFNIPEIGLYAPDIALYPIATPKRTLSTDGGASFTETDNVAPLVALILDPDQPFASGGGFIGRPEVHYL